MLISALALLLLLSNKYVSRALLRPLETRYPAIPEFIAGQPVPPQIAACEFVYIFGGGNGFSPGMAATNLLSSNALARTVEAVRILRVLPQAKLVVSGPSTAERMSHAIVLGRAAQTLGVEPSRIILVDDAHDTEDEANAIKRIAGDAPVALVTSAWHMPRTMALSRSAGVNGVACPSDYRSHVDDAFQLDDLLWEVEALSRSSLAIRERIGYLWISLRGKT